MKYIGGDLKLLALFAASVLIVFVVWLTLEKGNGVAGLGTPPAENTVQRFPVPSERDSGQRQFQNTYAAEKTAPRPIPGQQGGAVYKWIDEKGTVSFSDRPMNPEAERIAVQPAPAYSYPQEKQFYRAQATSRQVVSTIQNSPAPIRRVPSTWSRQTRRVVSGTYVTEGGRRITAYASHVDSALSFEGRVSGESAVSPCN